MSFQDYDYFRPGGWVGFGNYAWAISNPEFLKSVVVTTTFTVFATGLTFSSASGWR